MEKYFVFLEANCYKICDIFFDNWTSLYRQQVNFYEENSDDLPANELIECQEILEDLNVEIRLIRHNKREQKRVEKYVYFLKIY